MTKGKKERVTVLVEPGLLARIEAVKGLAPLSAFIEDAARRRVEAIEGAMTVPKVKR